MKRLRRWLARFRRPPLAECDQCGKPTRHPVKVIDRFDEEHGGGSAMVATFCPDHAPKETSDAA